jgi:amidase
VIQIVVDGHDVPQDQITVEKTVPSDAKETIVRFGAWATTSKPTSRDEGDQTMAPVARDKTMVVVVARSTAGGYPTGWLGML